MTLTIAHVTASDAGDYYCHAENVLGAVTRPVSVRLRNSAAGHNVTECCREQNVSPACNDACGFYLDIEAVIDRPECLKDFDKLMKCAADGSGRIILFVLFIYFSNRDKNSDKKMMAD